MMSQAEVGAAVKGCISLTIQRQPHRALMKDVQSLWDFEAFFSSREGSWRNGLEEWPLWRNGLGTPGYSHSNQFKVY